MYPGIPYLVYLLQELLTGVYPGTVSLGGGKFQNRVNYPGHVTGECAGRSAQYVTARGVNREGGEWHLHAVGPEKRESLDNLKPGIHYCVLYILRSKIAAYNGEFDNFLRWLMVP